MRLRESEREHSFLTQFAFSALKLWVECTFGYKQVTFFARSEFRWPVPLHSEITYYSLHFALYLMFGLPLYIIVVCLHVEQLRST